MPVQASVRFGLGLLLCGLVGATVALASAQWQREARSQILAEEATGGHVEAGEASIQRYGCGGCHAIPGISSADGSVGPSLDKFKSRAEIAGVLPNRPDTLVHWIREPQAVVPGNGMPNQGITVDEARDIAAYLYTIE